MVYIVVAIKKGVSLVDLILTCKYDKKYDVITKIIIIIKQWSLPVFLKISYTIDTMFIFL
jgi:hypothetical protein